MCIVSLFCKYLFQQQALRVFSIDFCGGFLLYLFAMHRQVLNRHILNIMGLIIAVKDRVRKQPVCDTYIPESNVADVAPEFGVEGLLFCRNVKYTIPGAMQVVPCYFFLVIRAVLGITGTENSQIKQFLPGVFYLDVLKQNVLHVPRTGVMDA